ncbi:MAG: 3-phosphoshikimate 1-carboxyvinyltransferase [Bacteroidales bacterium]|nr:3-phosphoshikimate 1-carboxyvinyltransferase [Bacteroidales bacterium]MBN2633418.1 3-phosphoshikimate 1-carboxyvinyltransferase [Bacteroidales bacterium]
MVISVSPSSVSGNIKAPSSKSMTQRAIAAALLADGGSTIINPSFCNDSLAALSIAENLGAVISETRGELKITGSGKPVFNTLDCGESGLAIRMFSPVAALWPDEITMTGRGSLVKRPMSMISDALTQFGVVCKSNMGFLPLTIKGPLTGGECETDGSVSSQLLTGLLMALPVAQGDSIIKVNDLRSRPYIDMTLEVLEHFGISVTNDRYSVFTIPGGQTYRATKFAVESDWSGGAFLLVAGAIAGEITVEELRAGSRQSDRAILTALERAGAKMTINERSVKIVSSDLNSFEFDSTESPDLFPPLVALASYCRGTSRIKGVNRLIYKESNRAEALVTEFSKLNIKIEVSADHLLVTGGRPGGGVTDSHNDHRIAMALATAALGASERIVIREAECIKKSYPGFYDDMRMAGARIDESSDIQ